MGEDIQGVLQTLTTGQTTGTECAAQGHKINIVVIWGGGVLHSVNKTVVLSRGVDETGREIHGLIRHQVLIRALHNRVVRLIVRAAIVLVEHFLGQISQYGRAFGERLRARGAEDARGGRSGGQRMEKRVGVFQQ